MTDITVQELNQRIADNDAPVMIDVREPHEWQMQHLDGVEKISLGRFGDPDVQMQLRGYEDKEVVFICRSGGRSGRATAFARQLGAVNARNLTGGMLAWKENVDPTFEVI
jgi:adenylyltransferase/sulfurtransferase